MKRLWIIANWKSNKTLEDALQWLDHVGPQLPQNDQLKVVVCPQMFQVEQMHKVVSEKGYPLLVGVQNLSQFSEGSYTGEVTSSTLKGIADIAILGHSERRKYFAETDEQVSEKVQQAKNNGIIPLTCVQDANTPISVECTLVAYEPVFAIGTGTPDTPENANQVSGEIKNKNNQVTDVLYGGSVDSNNCATFTSQENIAGLLIGRASLDPAQFVQIITNCVAHV